MKYLDLNCSEGGKPFFDIIIMGKEIFTPLCCNHATCLLGYQFIIFIIYLEQENQIDLQIQSHQRYFIYNHYQPYCTLFRLWHRPCSGSRPQHSEAVVLDNWCYLMVKVSYCHLYHIIIFINMLFSVEKL